MPIRKRKDQESAAGEAPERPAFTPTQGRYLAFIDLYTRLNRQPPAETDIALYVRASPPAVHQMIVTLHQKGLIEREPGQARSIRVLVDPAVLPPLEAGLPVRKTPVSLASAFPAITAWISGHGGMIEIGYDPNTDTSARAIDEGGMLWGGGERGMSLDAALQLLDRALGARQREWE